MSIPKNQQEIAQFAANEGAIVDGEFVSDTLWSMNKRSKKYSKWAVVVGIEGVSVTKEFIDRKDLPPGAKAYYFTRFGQEDSAERESEKTYFSKGNNIGRANYTTPFTLALSNARRLYTVKLKGGHSRSKTDILTTASLSQLIHSRSRGDHPWRVFLMALKNVNESTNWKHVRFPCDIQPKYDGTRFVVVTHPELPKFKDIGHVDAYSRRGETYEGQDDILRELYPVLEKYPGLHLDGELWKEGFGREDISGSSRRKEDSRRGSAIELNFMVFDCFYIEKPDEEWERRKELLEEVFAELPENRAKMVESATVDSKEELMDEYQSYLDDNLEGGVIRMMDGKYEFGLVKELRSVNAMKIKPRPDAEWPVADFKQGMKGKERGLVIWVLDHNGKKFSVTPNMPSDKRSAIFRYLDENKEEFESEFKGKEMTVTYDRVSATGIPQQPKALYFKDEQVQELLERKIEEY
jgi:ATP-dependent DNA ligase